MNFIAKRSIESFADDYARSSRGRLQPVSMTTAVTTLRALMPECAYSDSELVNLIAAKVIYYGQVVDFDGRR